MARVVVEQVLGKVEGRAGAVHRARVVSGADAVVSWGWSSWLSPCLVVGCLAILIANRQGVATACVGGQASQCAPAPPCWAGGKAAVPRS